jgi:aspartyl protease family protein
VTTLSPTTARAAGIEPSGLPVLVGTANGTIQIRRGRAERFEVGTIVREDLSVHLANEEFDVVGMNFLRKLSRWSVEGRWLILQP